MEFDVDYAKAINPLTVNGEKIQFYDEAEHVGMLRSTAAGNHVAILDRIKTHKKSLGAILHVGLSKGHRGNPATSLHIQQLYGTPVLMSGLAPLVISSSEVSIVEQHFKETLRSS